MKTRCLGFERPFSVVERPLRIKRVTISCSNLGRSIIGPYFVNQWDSNEIGILL